MVWMKQSLINGTKFLLVASSFIVVSVLLFLFIPILFIAGLKSGTDTKGKLSTILAPLFRPGKVSLKSGQNRIASAESTQTE